jgi:acid stress-induced BolA-like protein IbaG/YrbA
MIANDIKIMLRDNLPNAEIIVESDDDTHFEAIVVTDAFTDKKSLERQKMVYAVLGEHITSGSIHALSLKTFTQQEWQDKCAS